MEEKVLFVDDDANLLSSYQRSLRKEINIETALGGKAAIEAIKKLGPFAVIVSDFRMPEMDGIQFLALARGIAPRSVRIMLTGYADLQTAIDAVNQGNIFRLLTKPCPPETLALVLTAGIEQYRLVMAEKDILERTLSGGIKVLTDILSLVNPRAFSHAARVRRIVKQLAGHLGLDNTWQLEIAAMLSQLGCVTIPDEILAKVFTGKSLNETESKMYQGYAKAGASLIANIPRLEKIAQIIANQEQRYDGSGGEGPKGNDIPLESRILKVALDHDILVMAGLDSGLALVEIHKKGAWYDPGAVTALEKLITVETGYAVREVGIDELSTSMIIAEDIIDENGLLLVAKGQEVTASMRLRLVNFRKSMDVKSSIKVILLKE
ncbi:MAG: response regulator [Spirochaetes bacterium]|nr:MAG: response regulator [Spirochaetota bacterium]